MDMGHRQKDIEYLNTPMAKGLANIAEGFDYLSEEFSTRLLSLGSLKAECLLTGLDMFSLFRISNIEEFMGPHAIFNSGDVLLILVIVSDDASANGKLVKYVIMKKGVSTPAAVVKWPCACHKSHLNSHDQTGVLDKSITNDAICLDVPLPGVIEPPPVVRGRGRGRGGRHARGRGRAAPAVEPAAAPVAEPSVEPAAAPVAPYAPPVAGKKKSRCYSLGLLTTFVRLANFLGGSNFTKFVSGVERFVDEKLVFLDPPSPAERRAHLDFNRAILKAFHILETDDGDAGRRNQPAAMILLNMCGDTPWDDERLIVWKDGSAVAGESLQMIRRLLVLAICGTFLCARLAP